MKVMMEDAIKLTKLRPSGSVLDKKEVFEKPDFDPFDSSKHNGIV